MDLRFTGSYSAKWARATCSDSTLLMDVDLTSKRACCVRATPSDGAAEWDRRDRQHDFAIVPDMKTFLTVLDLWAPSFSH